MCIPVGELGDYGGFKWVLVNVVVVFMWPMLINIVIVDITCKPFILVVSLVLTLRTAMFAVYYATR